MGNGRRIPFSLRSSWPQSEFHANSSLRSEILSQKGKRGEGNLFSYREFRKVEDSSSPVKIQWIIGVLLIPLGSVPPKKGHAVLGENM